MTSRRNRNRQIGEFLKELEANRVPVADLAGVHEVSEMVMKILKLIVKEPLSMALILEALGHKSRNRNVRTAIKNLVQEQLIALTVPDKPKSRKQQYKITALGHQVFEVQSVK